MNDFFCFSHRSNPVFSCPDWEHQRIFRSAIEQFWSQQRLIAAELWRWTELEAGLFGFLYWYSSMLPLVNVLYRMIYTGSSLSALCGLTGPVIFHWRHPRSDLFFDLQTFISILSLSSGIAQTARICINNPGAGSFFRFVSSFSAAENASKNCLQRLIFIPYRNAIYIYNLRFLFLPVLFIHSLCIWIWWSLFFLNLYGFKRTRSSVQVNFLS